MQSRKSYSCMLESEQDMLSWGKAFALSLQRPCQIHLVGNLGAGKTTLVRGVLQGLGYSGVVHSPTYTLIEPYDTSAGVVYHLDLYRLGDAEELEYLGIRDIESEQAICLIEWPEKGLGFLPPVDLEIYLTVEGNRRLLDMNAASPVGVKRIEKFTNSDH